MKLLSTVMTILFALASCAERIEVDIAPLAAFGNATTGETNDWLVCTIGAYADGALQFNAHDDRLVSPVFPRSIVKVEAGLKSSANASRVLRFVPDAGEDLARNAEPCASSSQIEQQTFSWSAEDGVRQLTISLSGGGTAIWGLGSLAIHLVDACSPRDPATRNVAGTRLTVCWGNEPGTVSNRVDVATTEEIAEEVSIYKRYSFDEFSNGAKTSDQTARILAAYPELDGVRLTLPTNSTGEIQISQRDEKGVLTLPAPPSAAAANALRLTARHYNHEDEARTVSVGYIDADGTTNDFHTVALTATSMPHIVPLPETSTARRIILNNTGCKTRHRVIVADLALLTGYAPGFTRTNTVATATVAGDECVRIGGLSPRTRYLVSVTAFGPDGLPSEPSFTSVTTAESDPGLVISLR